MAKKVKPLSDMELRRAKEGDVLRDGGGLYLVANGAGKGLWRHDYRFNGKRLTNSFGAYPSVALAQAREKRLAAQKLLADGIDPMAEKKRAKLAAKVAAAHTFEAVAREWHENKSADWTENTRRYTINRLERDVFPAIGSRPIADLEAPELLDLLRKVEARGVKEIAKRLRQCMSQVFRYAIVTRRCSRDPAADLEGALKATGGKMHHRAMPVEELPAFLKALDNYQGSEVTALALRLMVLTFVRTTELRAARWDEFDLSAAEWRIPAARMKMRDPHIVPLSRQAVAVIEALKPLAGRSPMVFPSPGKEGTMSNNTLLFALYRMGWHKRATIHGFRALASTQLNEMGFNKDWIERQLAHGERDQVRASYNHAQYLRERRRMMQQWADWLDGVRRSVEVNPLRCREPDRSE